MPTETLTLTDFLLARITEDEAWWNGEGGYWARECQECAALSDFQPGPGLDQMLAECEAKRRIVAEHRLITDPRRLVKVWRDPTPGVACECCAGDALGDRPLEDIGPCDTLRALALPYADHPDYREEWKP